MTITYQAPLTMGFSRQEYWSGLPFPFPGDLPNPGIEPGSLALQADALPSEPPGKTDPCKCLTLNSALRLPHPILKATLQIGLCYYYLHLTDEKTEAQREKVFILKSQAFKWMMI